MKNTSTEERELHTAQNIINAGTGQSADVEQMCEWFEKHPKAKNLLTDVGRRDCIDRSGTEGA